MHCYKHHSFLKNHLDKINSELTNKKKASNFQKTMETLSESQLIPQKVENLQYLNPKVEVIETINQRVVLPEGIERILK